MQKVSSIGREKPSLVISRRAFLSLSIIEQLVILIPFILSGNLDESFTFSQVYETQPQMVKKLLKCLEEELKTASVELKIDIGLAISHFQDEEIQVFFNKCVQYIAPHQIQVRAFGHITGQPDGGNFFFHHRVLRCLPYSVSVPLTLEALPQGWRGNGRCYK